MNISIPNNHSKKHEFAEAVAQRCPVRKVFLEIPQNWQENTCVFFKKIAPLVAASEFEKHRRNVILSIQIMSVAIGNSLSLELLNAKKWKEWVKLPL